VVSVALQAAVQDMEEAREDRSNLVARDVLTSYMAAVAAANPKLKPWNLVKVVFHWILKDREERITHLGSLSSKIP
jgi:hypothetical protein